MTDREIINQHADRLCLGLDLADGEDARRLHMRILALRDRLDAEMEAIEAEEALHGPDWVGHFPRRRALTLRSDAIGVAWQRARVALGGEPDPAGHWGRQLAASAEARANIDQAVAAFLEELRGALGTGPRD